MSEPVAIAEVCIRRLHTSEEMQAVVELEVAVWATPPVEVLPAPILIAIAHNGGQVLGAFVGQTLIGMSVGLPAWRDGEQFLWSHMAGVHPEWQGSGVGTALKLRQHELAGAEGFRSVRWTFDPLQRGNANFNFRLPGVWANQYYVNHYGEMDDGINAGLPSDRLEAHWPASAARVRKSSIMTSAGQLMLLADAQGQPEARDLSDNGTPKGIEIPRGLADLKRHNPALSLAWRLAVRAAFVTAFAQGYRATAFSEVAGRAAYLLEMPQPWFLYVLRCGDGTLYTGISVDVQRRLRQHNNGRGATYTAARRPLQLLACWRYRERGSAQRAESAFKNLARPSKLAQIQAGAPWQGGNWQRL